MNDALYLLYQKYWNNFIEYLYIPRKELAEHTKINAAAYPFLIKVTNHYQTATKRIMICGQETQGWGKTGKSTIETMDEVIHEYDHFVNKDNISTAKIKKPGKNSPYWNFIWRIMQSFPEYGFVQQNLVKVGKAKAAHCDEEINNAANKYFPVFLDELTILKPNLILFLTGEYDARIQSLMGDFTKEHIGQKEDCFDILSFVNPSFPLGIRINHPGWLQRNNLYYKRLQEIREQIKQLL